MLVAGATGMLGAEIARALLDRGGAEVLSLVRRGGADAPEERDGLRALTERGARPVEGDLADPASLDAAVRGLEVVVSAVQGGREVIMDGQRALLDAAKRAGVRRMLPSDFAIDLFAVDRGMHPLLNMRREADEAVAAGGLEHMHVLNGVFTKYLFHPAFGAFDFEKGEVAFWGDGRQAINTTTTNDTARYAAEAALDRALPSGKFAVAGDQVGVLDAARVAGEAEGRELRPRSLGSIAGLEREVEAAKARVAGDASGDPSKYAPFYALAVFSGWAKLKDLQNGRYPHIRPATLRDHLATAKT